MEWNNTPNRTALLAAAVALGATMIATPVAHAAEHEVKGNVAEQAGTCPSLRFKVGAQVVVTDNRTKFDDGVCADVKNGRRVEVEGSLRKDGTLLATEVELE